MTNEYELRSFNPEFAKDIDYTGYGIMFSYNDPELLEQAQEFNAGEAPEEIIISLTDSSIILYPVYHWVEDEEPEDCFLLICRKAGLNMLEWAAKEAYGFEGAELAEYVQGVFLRMAYEPTDGGGICLDDLPGEQRKAVNNAYDVMLGGL